MNITFLGPSLPKSLVENPWGPIFLSISCLQRFSGGRENTMQGIHADFSLRAFREKRHLCPSAVIPLQFSRQHLGVCNVCMQLPSAVINNAFDALPSEELTKEAAYKEKFILQTFQEESGEKIGRITTVLPHFIYVKRVFTFQKAFSVGLVLRDVFGGLESTLWTLKYFKISEIQLPYRKELLGRLPLLPKYSSSASWMPMVWPK